MGRKYFDFIEKLDIKILILFILRNLSEPVPIDELIDLTISDEGISYFDFMECVAELVESDHIKYKGGVYGLTEKGARNGKATENNLPYGLRNHAEKATYIHRGIQKRNAMINTVHTEEPDGTCTVSLSMADGLGEVFSITLHAVNEKQALTLEQGFRKRAECVYKAMIEVILEKY